MSKKLLEEQAVRKFMKIAGLQPLTNTFLKESETVEEAYGKKMEDEAVEKDGEKLEEVASLEEGGGQMPVDSESRREDDRDMARGRDLGEAKKMEEEGKEKVEEGKALSAAKPAKMKGAPASQKMKPAKKAGGLVKEEEMPEEDMADVEAPEAPAAGGLDVEGLVKELIRVITEKVPGAADVVSVEEEGDETEIEMGGDESAPGHEAAEGEMPAGEEEEEEEEEEGMAPHPTLDEAALEKVVAETVKRVKARLMESKKPKAAVTKEALAKKVAAKVAERLKKA
jgi:hypothetical protein